MQVSKWHDHLGVRLPAEVIESLGLKEGDEVEIQLVRKRTIEPTDEISRDEALSRLRARRLPLPPDWKFDREEANAR